MLRCVIARRNAGHCNVVHTKSDYSRRGCALMLLDLFSSRLIQTTHFDGECAELADRHYSRRTVGARQFCYSGRKLVLRDVAGTVVFVWMYPDPALRMDDQVGYYCSIFRNESARRSSEIILEAEQFAVAKWGPARGYTFIDPSKIASRNPGYCFKMAGWAYEGTTKSGKHILAKELSPISHDCLTRGV